MGIGSKLKKAIRKVIPNELAEVAVKAAPFVAPFNPVAAAGLAALGGFDQTGRIGSSVRSGLGTYALGQGARMLGGAGLQSGFGGTPGGGVGSYFTSPFSGGQLFGTAGGADPIFGGTGETKFFTGGDSNLNRFLKPQEAQIANTGVSGAESTVGAIEGRPNMSDIAGPLTDTTATATAKSTTLGEFIKAPFAEKSKMAMEWFNSLSTDKKIALGISGATTALAFLENKAMENDSLDLTLGQEPGYFSQIRGTSSNFVNPSVQFARNGGIIGLANGGEPAMEMDYRDGGFIPVGAYERADDVPARLSKNEFVMTADAVRAAGGGSIEKGSQRMYDLMNNLETQA